MSRRQGSTRRRSTRSTSVTPPRRGVIAWDRLLREHAMAGSRSWCPIASARCAWLISSSCSLVRAWLRWGPTKLCSPRAGHTPSSTGFRLLPIADRSHDAGGFNLKPEVTGHKKAQTAQKEKSGVETVVNYQVKTTANANPSLSCAFCAFSWPTGFSRLSYPQTDTQKFAFLHSLGR